MSLFSAQDMAKINAIAEKSKALNQQPTKTKRKSNSELEEMSRQVEIYFKDSPAILIETPEDLHDYIDKCIEAGYAGIDTETTGLDRVHDTIVGSSLYYPGGVECYIPNKHMVPIFDQLRKNQLTYEQCQAEFQRLVDNNCKMIFAYADFDIAMLYKDYKVDFIDVCYYDVILAWRCIKEDEPHNGLKQLYNKYVLGGKGDPKKFTDFFDVKSFPYCKPEIAKLYAANDAKITYDLFVWQLPYINKNDPKCKQYGLENIADIVWGIEFPMIKACAEMHRTGMYLDTSTSKALQKRYNKIYEEALQELKRMVQHLLDTKDVINNSKRPFRSSQDFNPKSTPHAKYLCYDLLNLPVPESGKYKGKQTTDKETLAEFSAPEVKQLLKVRSLSTLIGTFVDKMPKAIAPDHRIHATFNSVGASTGRMCIAEGMTVTVTKDNKYFQKEIQDIELGDEVLSLDQCIMDQNFKYRNTSMYLTKAPVVGKWLTNKNTECIKLTYNTGESLICTPTHPILVKDEGWMYARDTLGCRVVPLEFIDFDPLQRLVVIDSIEPAGKYDVYDIEVKDHHNFFAQGICVHNSSSSPNLQNIPSHHKDIRHMFTATPAKDEVIDCEDDETTISIILSKFDTIFKEDGEVYVEDLKEGDVIELLNDHNKEYKSVKFIEFIGYTDVKVTFNK